MQPKTICSAIFNPFKNLVYFEQYFSIVEQICVCRNVFYIRLCKVINLIMVAIIVRYAYLAFGCPECGHTKGGIITPWHTLNFDIWFAVSGRPFLNLLAILCTCSIIYANSVLFLYPNYRILCILRQLVIFENWSAFFLAPKWNNQLACEKLRKCFVLMVNLFQSVNLCFCKVTRV